LFFVLVVLFSSTTTFLFGKICLFLFFLSYFDCLDLFPSPDIILSDLSQARQQRTLQRQARSSKIISFNYVLRNSFLSLPVDAKLAKKNSNSASSSSSAAASPSVWSALSQSSLHSDPLKLHGQQFKQVYARKTQLITQHKNAQLFYIMLKNLAAGSGSQNNTPSSSQASLSSIPPSLSSMHHSNPTPMPSSTPLAASSRAVGGAATGPITDVHLKAIIKVCAR
jgi:hypothetical protein